VASTALIRNLALQRGLDPAAVLAVASSEGLSGGIGDSGHAFGPWQLNNAGGVITGKFSGMSPTQINQWAWSPAGLKYALDRIGGVARGLKGPAAVSAIVNRFERPAAPIPEIQRATAALGRYGGGSGGGAQGSNPVLPVGSSPGSLPPLATGSTPLAQTTNPRAGLLNAIITGLQQGKDVYSLLPQALANNPIRPSAPLQAPVRSSPPPVGQLPIRTPVQPSQGLRNAPVASGSPWRFAELLHEGVGGPTHSTGEHIHVASTDPNTMLRAISLAQSMGLRVGENPYTDPVDPVHATNSYHYRTFPTLYSGKHLGEAADVTGPRMLEFYNRLNALR